MACFYTIAASKERLQGYKAELSTIKEIKQRYESLVDIGAVSIVQVLQQRSAVEKLLTKNCGFGTGCCGLVWPFAAPGGEAVLPLARS